MPFVTFSPGRSLVTSIHYVCSSLLFPSCCVKWSTRCVKWSTPNPNVSYLYSDLTQLQVYVCIIPTNFDLFRKNYQVYICTPMSYTGFCGSAPVLEQLPQGQCWQQCVGIASGFCLGASSRTFLLGIFNPPQKKREEFAGQICVPNRPQTTLCSHAVPASLLLVFYMGAKDTFYCL